MKREQRAVKLQKPDKSPGEDGIVSVFNKQYWFLIGEDFGSVVREILDQKLLCEFQPMFFISSLSPDLNISVIFPLF
jgi:hypothetical protein